MRKFNGTEFYSFLFKSGCTMIEKIIEDFKDSV
ncbi:hypothetical protein LEP1GSC150_3532, partial [Leptospira interrogans serovar Copenhageni str. LT2050]